jgi:predicted nucleic acid-binding protein
VITEPVLLDTGPLVALLHREDASHNRCRKQADEIVGQVFTTWPVVTEAAWLLRKLPDGLERLLQVLIDRDIDCRHLEPDAMNWMSAAARHYHDLSPQLADLSLLYLAERIGIHYIFTLDRRDFTVYRQSNGKPFDLLPSDPV